MGGYDLIRTKIDIYLPYIITQLILLNAVEQNNRRCLHT